MKNLKRLKVYIIAIILIVIDQITKILVINKVKDNPITIIKGILKFTYCENTGAAFSMGDGNVPIFIILTFIMLLILIVMFEKNRGKYNVGVEIFFTMVIAGGVSNLIDRIARGFVVDFINVNDLIQFAIFNVADIFVVIGIIGMAIMMMLKNKSINK